MAVLKYKDPVTGETKKVGIPTDDTYKTHIADLSNPHGVTVEQIGAATVEHNHDGIYTLASHETNKSNPHGVTYEQIGAAKSDHNHDSVYSPIISRATTLPDTGVALVENTIYNVSAAIGEYIFAPPSTGWAHGKFTTGASVAIKFTSGSFVGAVPEFAASTTYEFDVLDGVWAFAEVVTG